MNSLFNQAGGVPYHFRALRNRRMWQGFRFELASWLDGWRPTETHLALVGPSAGYNLPLLQLGRFEVITAFEPDPLACWLMARSLKNALGTKMPRLNFVHADHLVAHPDRLLAFLKRESAAVLFCNVVGQLVHLLPSIDREERLLKIRLRVHDMLHGRSWASFHDRVSGPLAPNVASLRSQNRLSDEDLVARAYPTEESSTQGATARATTVELFDHHTEGFFPPELPHVYLDWQLERACHHLIEGVYSCV